jgi:hypothetical protein
VRNVLTVVFALGFAFAWAVYDDTSGASAGSFIRSLQKVVSTLSHHR